MMNFIIGLFLFLFCTLLFIIYKGWIRLSKFNQSPLIIKTFDGTNSPYHPSVIKIEGIIDGKYKYMMAETPFCFSRPSKGVNYRDQFECPSIHFSIDGVCWEEININPIDILNEYDIINKDYFSDPDLVISPNGIECWYRLNRRYGIETNQKNISLLRKTTRDGKTWTSREEIVNCERQDSSLGIGKIVISPGVIYEDCYKCWYIDDIHLGDERICYSVFDEKDGTWRNKKYVNMNGPKITPWHLHVLKDHGIYWLTLYDHKNISIWKGYNELEFNYVKTILTPNNKIGSFYSHNLYRACLIKINDKKWRLYFSADDMFKSYIGLMEGESPETMTVRSVNEKPHSSFSDYLSLVFKTWNHLILKKYQLNKNRIMWRLKALSNKISQNV